MCFTQQSRYSLGIVGAPFSGTETMMQSFLLPGCWCSILWSATEKGSPVSCLISTAGCFNLLNHSSHQKCLVTHFQYTLAIAAAHFAAPQGRPSSFSCGVRSIQHFRSTQVPSPLHTPASSLFCCVFRASDLSAIWNMKSFARHRLLLEPDGMIDNDAGMPRSKL